MEQILPGTLCADISPKQLSAIEHGIFLGRKLQISFPNIGKLYKEGMSLSQLIKYFDLTVYLNVNFKVAETAVYRALCGHSGDFKATSIETYTGLLSREELEACGKEHNISSGREVGKRMFAEKKGFFAFSKEEQNEVRKKSVLACGNVPYSQAELDYIEHLASKPEFRKGNLIKVFEIAFEVNIKFHAGVEVRKPSSITKTRIRERKKKEKQTTLRK